MSKAVTEADVLAFLKRVGCTNLAEVERKLEAAEQSRAELVTQLEAAERQVQRVQELHTGLMREADCKLEAVERAYADTRAEAVEEALERAANEAYTQARYEECEEVTARRIAAAVLLLKEKPHG